jgi:UDP-glucose 4-epimerase
MRIVVTGATGNVGTSVVSSLARDPQVESIVGVARRLPAWKPDKTEWVAADVARSDLRGVLRGADAVVHLAWLIQPSRDEIQTRRVNVDGSRRVFEAAVAESVASIVYASSVGAYSRGPKDRRVDESWPTNGIETSFYSRQKAEVESLLDRFSRDEPRVRLVRLRPGLIFKRESATEIRRLFAGPFLPPWATDPRFIPIVPDGAGKLVFQAVHADDVGEAYRLALHSEAEGAFNIAADPILDAEELARTLGARPVRVPEKLLRAAAEITWRMRLQPTPPGWVDMAMGCPLMETTRAREELGWTPSVPADAALLELLEGMRQADGMDTPPLDPSSSGPLRVREFRTGIGARSL